MKILVLGAGVVGTTTAYYLREAGHEVTVLDRQPGAGLETSFANAGQVSPGYSAPWAGPGVPLKAIKWMMMTHRPLVIRPLLEPFMWRWMALMLRNCTEAAYHVNKGRMVRLAEYSRDCLLALRVDTAIRYDDRQRGTLQLFRTQKQLDHVAEDTAVLDEGGVPYNVLDHAGCVAAEPALAHAKGTFLGGLQLPGDETGDAHQFTQRLAALAAEKGVVFQYGTEIERIDQAGGRATAVVAGGVTYPVDQLVVALGSYSRKLLGPLGIDIPVYPVKGYSITIPIESEAGAPVSTVMDETYKVAITRLGDRIRVGGTAELAGFSAVLSEPRRETLAYSVSNLFPEGGDVKKASFWTGLRPMTPDGTPIIGRTKIDNLWLNTGHGTLGWTMSCGSARVLADLISGKQPDIQFDDLAISRYAA
ncbi:D-amino acid dehydrogenase [Acidisphaera sp. L21]|uniref:D-amino acid dehydrogenase n=1 Tax=Acidisphaera sp. L21 TaxID=1641851 RepID=UPI00131A717A|nr:D-amino acid dehydrogenase [Acidisphaera sp. L21]